MLTLRGICARLLSAVRKNPNTKKVMMTNEQIISEIENAPRYQINYERLDGKTNEYTVAIFYPCKTQYSGSSNVKNTW